MSKLPDIETVDLINKDNKKFLSSYKIVGSHSAISLCHWTKLGLRTKEDDSNRGYHSCYKNTFYGIDSRRCNQASCSVVCASRCVFCWRDYDKSMPPSLEWKPQWRYDEPKKLYDSLMKAYVDEIHSAKQSKKVSEESIKFSAEVRHLALSLIGEPVIYPAITQLCQEAHAHGVSTFVVTNAQHPDQIEALGPVTQLYLSVDAPNENKLFRIDRSLAGKTGSYERLLSSLDILAKKKHRTAIRLTGIKGLNMTTADIEGYVELIKRGNPDFLEVKGFALMGHSTDERALKRENVPTHEEVVEFTHSLVACLDDYEYITSHRRSRATMCAHKKYKIDGKWKTHINFDKFCAAPETEALDYSIETPEWAFSELIQSHYDPK